MRIAFFGSDVFASVPLALQNAGHRVEYIYSPFATRLPVAVRWAAVERACGVRVMRRLVERSDLELLYRAGIDLVLSAGYPRRLPVRPGDPVPALNIHPSPLPEGRGPRPYEWAILTGRTNSAVTLHEMVERFDAGPILFQRTFELEARETTSSLELRVPAIAAETAVEVVGRFPEIWAARETQGTGSYCRTPDRAQRTLEPSGSVVQMDRVLRAFNPGGVYVRLDGKNLVVFDAVCWPEPHQQPPGRVLAVSDGSRLVAAADGFLLLRSALPERLARLRFAAAKLKRFIG